MAKKRANGEGSIRKKPSGRWEGRYTQGIDPVTGRAIQKSVSATTQAECKEKLAKAIRENRGVPLNHTGDYTAAEWCRLWFETYSKPNIRYNTAKGYEGFVDPFHEFITGNDDAAAQGDGGEIPAVGYLIGVGQTDAQHMGHILHGQHQWEFIKRIVFGFSHSVPFYLPRGRVLFFVLRPSF